jgi:hemerythrin-like metal-binding protein
MIYIPFKYTLFKEFIMIEKSSLSRINHDEINVIHEEEVKLLDSLLSLVKEGKDLDAITSAFEALIDHMAAHFSFEESLMQGQSYAMYTIHQAEHYKVLNEAKYRMMLWTSSKDVWDLDEYLSDDLLEWYGQHIDAMDKPLADFLALSKGEL